MISSGIKRGLAASAVSALAVAGLPLLAGSASADSYMDQLGNTETRLYSQYSGFGSVQNDGTNTKVHLLAGGGEDVVQVRFEYTEDRLAGTPVWKAITTVSRANGGFSAEWDVPTGIYNLPNVAVRAVALNNVGTEIGTADQASAVVGSAQPAVDIANAPGSTVNVFKQPYTVDGKTAQLGVISGKTSDVSAGVDVEVSNLTTGAPTGTNDAVEADAANGLREWKGAVDFSGYGWDATPADGTVNQAVVGAKSGSDDAELVNLVEQKISTVTAVADPSTVQGANKAKGVVTVKDAAGNPIAGAQVFEDADNDGVHDAAETFKYTDANGEAIFSGVDGLSGSAAGTQHVFIVNTDDGDDYDASADYRRTVTVTSYTPAASTITAASHDGAAFDFDEYTAGDIKVTVKDQNSNPKAGENVVGKWTMTAFSNGAVTTAAATITDNGDGTYTVAFPGTVEGSYKLDTWIEKDGNPGQSAGDMSAAPLTLAAGEANVVWNDGGTAQAPAGTTATFKGVIELDDHTALPNRNVAFTWAKNATGNAVVAAQSAQPAGTTRTGDTGATGTADGSGHFGVAISDPAASPQPAELNGSLTVTPASTTDYGTNTDGSDVLDVDFLADSAVDQTATAATVNQDDLSTSAAPGRPVHVDITVLNAAGTALTDLPVKVTTDHGFFTTPDATTLSELKPSPAAAAGANYGEWEDKGASYDTTTDDSGYAEAVVAIERDPGFDDDGMVDATVTFVVGGKSFDVPVTFDSSDPMNPGEVKVVLDDNQTVSVLPKAPTTENVWFDVFATDQFGNLTDVPVNLSDGSSPAKMWDNDGAGSAIDNGDTVTSQFTDETPRFYSYSDAASAQTITGLWDNASTLVWKDAVADVAGVPATQGFQEEDALGVDGTDGTKTKDVTGSMAPINWYTIDYAASSYSLTHTGADTQPTGTTVTETYQAIDQNGEPIQNLDVTFFRTGPDNLQDGDGNSIDITDDLGKAYYVFQGAKSGTATITAVVRAPGRDLNNDGDWLDSGERGGIVPQGEKTDVVKFEGRAAIVAKLVGSNNGSKADVVKVDGPSSAAGAKVRLYKLVNGVRKFVMAGNLGTSGNKVFTVADKNGKSYTKYVAVVSPTAKTKGDTTNTKSVR